MDSALTLKALSYGLIGLLWVTGLVLSLVSVRKESRHGAPLKGLIGLTVVITVLCTFIALFTAYAEKARPLEKVSRPVGRVITEKDLPR